MYIFKHVVSNEAELRSILGSPSELVKNKVITYLDGHCRNFIAKSPFLLIATSDIMGTCDASPRGDAPGFVFVLNERFIVIPERAGNRRMDSMRNILSNPQVGLIFMIPGMEETLRVNGKASIIRDEHILVQMVVNGRTPLVGIAVEVEECFVHCAKAFKRSKLWDPASWITKESLPDIVQILADHAKLPEMNAEKIAEALKESYTKRLY